MSYRITADDPFRRTLFVLLALVGVAILMCIAYYYGVVMSGDRARSSQKEIGALEQKAGTLESLNAELLGQIAQLQRTTEVDETAASTVQQTLNSMEERIRELNDELSFYKRIVAPSKMEPGLYVQDLSIQPDDEERRYQYKLVLTQVRGNNRVAQGALDLYIDLYKDDRLVRYTLADLASSNGDRISFKFKYLQTVEGSVVLPAGYVPSGIEVRVTPSSSWLEPVERSFDWDASLVGGI